MFCNSQHHRGLQQFSFAYLQEAFVTALLNIVHTRRANLKQHQTQIASELVGSVTPEDSLESNEVWQAISKQVQTLWKGMKDNRKSVEDAAARSSSSLSAGFGLGRQAYSVR